MKKELLIDCNIFEPIKDSINENLNDPNKPFKVKGLLTTVEEKNQNGRIYKREVFKREIDRYQQAIKERRAVGELDHPDASIINLKNVSHNVINTWWDGDKLYGTIEILTTPSGNILRELIKNGIKVGVSSRAMGSVKETSDGSVVDDDLELICYDFVSTPSNHGSWMNLTESVNPDIIPTEIDKYSNVNKLIKDIITELS